MALMRRPLTPRRPRPAHGHPTAERGMLATLGVLVVSALLIFPLGQSAQARLEDNEPTRDVPRSNTELRITSLGSGVTLDGLRPSDGSAPTPLTPYPDTNPAGYTAISTFAGTINAASVDDPSLTAELYCINLNVETYVGIGYESGTWDESTVPNVDYVAYILNNYYPTTGEPSTLGENERAAAVQAAIWYFTDGLVVNTSSPAIRAATAAIVADAQQNGPSPEPAQPDVDITPTEATVPSDELAGPFTVTAENAAEVTVSVPDGYTMYSDAAGTTPLANPSTVASGTQIWVGSDGAAAGDTTLSARAEVPVQAGQVYLYDGNNPSLDDAQRLILADTTTLEAVAQADVSFFAAGSITVDKSFAGEAAGEQGAITLTVDCGADYTYTVNIDAGATTTQSSTFDGIPVDTECTVTEPTTGATTTVDVTTDAPQSGTITADGVTVTITNTVTFAPGGLRVVKTIAGPAAGEQGEIILDIDCGTALTETFTIPAGSTAGDYEQTYTDIPADTECTVTETESGASAEVLVATGDPVTVTVPAGGTVDAELTNTVTLAPGALRVVKTIAGPAAGEQDAITLTIDCGDALSETFTVPAGSAAGDYEETYSDIPAGTSCTVTETASGATTEVEVATGDPVTVEIAPAATVDAELTNTVTFAPGALRVLKTIAGPAAGEQGEITLTIDCGGTLSETFTVPAGSAAGDYEETYSDLPAGTSCTVTETASGATAEVDVATGDPVTVTIPAGTSVDAVFFNTVTFAPGGLRVVKTLDGEAAGNQDAIELTVECTGALVQTFTIPAGSPAGEYEQTFTDLPAGSTCTVTETATGETAQVEVAASDPVTVELLPAGTVDAELVNTASFAPGSLNVVKTVTGVAAGQQGAIVLDIDCGDALTTTFTVAAGSGAGDYAETFTGLPADTECTVTETQTGASDDILVTGDDPVTVVVPAGGTAVAALVNEVRDSGLAPTGGSVPVLLLVAGGGAAALGGGLLWLSRRRRGEAVRRL